MSVSEQCVLVDLIRGSCANGEVRIRRAATAITTFMVAIVVALAVPVSQVRLVSTVIACCCPDPANCHCPHDKPDRSTDPSVRPCHKTSHDVVSPTAPVFAHAAATTTNEPRAVFAVSTELAFVEPDAIDPARPDAPS
jgi:hypothetical protein